MRWFNFSLRSHSFQNSIHLPGEGFGGGSGGFGKIGAVRRIDDAAAAVHQQAALVNHAVFGNVFEASALCADARHEKEVTGSHLANLCETFGFGGAHNIHGIDGRTPVT